MTTQKQYCKYYSPINNINTMNNIISNQINHQLPLHARITLSYWDYQELFSIILQYYPILVSGI